MTTRKEILCALAESMRDFGYPDVTDEMAGEVMDAYLNKLDLPHGIVGMFMRSSLESLEEAGLDLSKVK